MLLFIFLVLVILFEGEVVDFLIWLEFVVFEDFDVCIEDKFVVSNVVRIDKGVVDVVVLDWVLG